MNEFLIPEIAQTTLLLPEDMLEANKAIHVSLGSLVVEGAEKLLSERDVQIVKGAAYGEPISKTAAQLYLGSWTVKNYRCMLRERLRVPGFSGVVYFAYANSLIPTDDGGWQKSVKLSPVETMMTKYLLYGYSRIEIAKQIGRSMAMINAYVSCIYDKLGVNKRPAVARRAFELGICRPSPM